MKTRLLECTLAALLAVGCSEFIHVLKDNPDPPSAPLIGHVRESNICPLVVTNTTAFEAHILLVDKKGKIAECNIEPHETMSIDLILNELTHSDIVHLIVRLKDGEKHGSTFVLEKHVEPSDRMVAMSF